LSKKPPASNSSTTGCVGVTTANRFQGTAAIGHVATGV
jgi:hypothetical protein